MKKRNKSIVQNDMSHCFVCYARGNLHIHEIFFGNANRKKSIEHDLYVSLCPRHHTASNDGVHHNKALDLRLKKIGQAAFEKTHTREAFMQIFGRNYL